MKPSSFILASVLATAAFTSLACTPQKSGNSTPIKSMSQDQRMEKLILPSFATNSANGPYDRKDPANLEFASHLQGASAEVSTQVDANGKPVLQDGKNLINVTVTYLLKDEEAPVVFTIVGLKNDGKFQNLVAQAAAPSKYLVEAACRDHSGSSCTDLRTRLFKYADPTAEKPVSQAQLVVIFSTPDAIAKAKLKANGGLQKAKGRKTGEVRAQDQDGSDSSATGSAPAPAQAGKADGTPVQLAVYWSSSPNASLNGGTTSGVEQALLARAASSQGASPAPAAPPASDVKLNEPAPNQGSPAGAQAPDANALSGAVLSAVSPDAAAGLDVVPGVGDAAPAATK